MSRRTFVEEVVIKELNLEIIAYSLDFEMSSKTKDIDGQIIYKKFQSVVIAYLLCCP